MLESVYVFIAFSVGSCRSQSHCHRSHSLRCRCRHRHRQKHRYQRTAHWGWMASQVM